ncbi:CAP domain-containing protein [Alkalihalobacillus sp. FSL W8-0930]
MNFKKIVVSSAAAAAITAVGFLGQADAASNTHVSGPYVIQFDAQDAQQAFNCLAKFPGAETINFENGQWVIDFFNQFDFEQAAEQPGAEVVEEPEQAEEVVEEEAVEAPAPVEEDVQAEEEAPQEEAAPQEDADTDAAEFSAEEQQMLDSVNKERESVGLSPLKADPELAEVARVKAQDMIDNNYFDHNSPTYGSPFQMMDQFGIEYRTAGENLAGNQTVEAAHQALMNSQGHRENILKADYTNVGIGIVDGGPYGKMFVQMFKG